jgi:N6-L-threonylcarbamoyladenine synthase
MIILGIESSCDETACALVRNGRAVLSSVILSQEKLHGSFNGVVPEIASRAHVENINGVIEKTLLGKGEPRHLIDAVAVTVGPGLVGSLLVGKMTAEALIWVWKKPLVGINHLEAHLFSNLLEHPDLSPPFIGLVVSGGHTDLVHVKDFGRYRVLGRTRDDAAGECFDKVAAILNLGYPGGPLIDRLSKMGNPELIRFPRPYLAHSWDFSFSGLKTAVLYYMRGNNAPDPKFIADVCASFQAAVVEVLVKKTIDAARKLELKIIAVGGGVAANSELRKKFLSEGKKAGIKIVLPSSKYCTDNAAMVASLGYYKLKKGVHAGHLTIDPSLPIRNWD